MKSIYSVVVLLLGLNFIAVNSYADIDVYEFSSEDKRQRYLDLTRELRCPKCQNQDIADSNAPIAQDMRREVHRMVEEGKGHNDVVNFMIERFGDFVTYKPKLVPSTYLLWFTPIILVLFGFIIVWMMASHKRKSAGETDKVEVKQRDKSKVKDLLEDYEKIEGQNPEEKQND